MNADLGQNPVLTLLVKRPAVLLGTHFSEIRSEYIWNCRLPKWWPFCPGGDSYQPSVTQWDQPRLMTGGNHLLAELCEEPEMEVRNRNLCFGDLQISFCQYMITAVTVLPNLSVMSKPACAFAFYISIWYRNGTDIEIHYKKKTKRDRLAKWIVCLLMRWPCVSQYCMV